jgi:hypothetical protein
MNSHIVLIAVLAIVLLALLFTLLRSDRSSCSKIDLEDLLLGADGKLSRGAAVLLGSFLMTTWVIVYLTYTGKLTEGYFTAYLATWVAPTIALLFKTPTVQAPAQESKT